MAKIGKKRRAANEKVDVDKQYELPEAMALIKEVNTAKFDASVDLHIRLGVDPRKPDQAIRGTVTLPNGTGKTKKVLVLCNPEKEEEAMAAGADYAGLDEYVKKIQDGWMEMDVIIATPNVMAQVGRIGRVLGPRGLMPNPKSGTVTNDVGAAVGEVKKGKIAFRVDKFGIIHNSIGRVGFTAEQLTENANELINIIMKMKPAAQKGAYVKSLTAASTMSPGIKIESKNLR